MNPFIRKYLRGTLVIAITLLTMLWSWNTLAALFNAPPAELRHALAAALLLLTIRTLFRPRPGHGAWRDEH